MCLRLTNCLQPGKMNHHIRPESGNALCQCAAIPEVGLVDVKRAVGQPANTRQRIGVAVRKIVDNTGLVISGQNAQQRV